MRHHLLHYVALPLGLATLIACGGAPAAASTATTSVPLPATSVSTAVPASEIAAAPAAVTVSATSEATAPSAAPAGFPVSVENCGRTLRFDRPPARIVTSFQTAAEAVVALGEAEKLVGLYFGQVHDLPPAMTEAFKHIPTLGERGYPSSEVVLNARPDLFLAYDLEGDLGGERANVREALEHANVQIFGMNCAAEPVNTTASYYERLNDLGRVLDREAGARTLIDMIETRIGAVQQKVQGREPVPSVFYYFGEGPFTVYGSGLVNELIESAGGANLFKTESSSFPSVNSEAIAAANPQAFFWADSGPLGASYLPADPLQFLFTTFANTDAAKNERGGAVPAAGLYPGVRMADAVEAMAMQMYPDAFADDPAATATP